MKFYSEPEIEVVNFKTPDMMLDVASGELDWDNGDGEEWGF